jgi:hypothetical protein
MPLLPNREELPKMLFPFMWSILREYKAAIILYISLSLAAGLWGPFNSMLLSRLIDLLPTLDDDGMTGLIH